ncbi:MAG: ABC transporter permease [Planctomycetes bacterium]|nr:ABC transporter permease [Planctomycetota bacterium]
MRKILKIAGREYIETVKTKTFIFGMLMTPLIIGVLIVVSSKMGDTSGRRLTVRVAVADLSGELSALIEDGFAKYNDSHRNGQIRVIELDCDLGFDAAEEQGKEKLRSGKVDACAVLDEDIIDGSGKIRLYTHKPKASILDALWAAESILREAVVDRRYEVVDIDREQVAKLRHVPTEQVEISLGAGEQVQSKGQRMAGMMVPFFFMYLIFMGMVGTGQHMLSSVIEEKSSRVIEVLLSAVTPFELMGGKILGLAGVGLTVVSLWGGGAYGAAVWQKLEVDVSLQLMVCFIVYYVLGFMMFSALLAGIGSICNTIKETQSLMMPVMMIFIVPLMAWFKLVQSPDGSLSRGLSFVPPLTPMVMVLRMSAGSEVGSGEIAATMALLLATVILVMWLAAKVFRTGILMYGKRPGLREIVRWMRQS